MPDIEIDPNISVDEGYSRQRGIVTLSDGLTVYAFVQNGLDFVEMWKSEDAGESFDGGTTISTVTGAPEHDVWYGGWNVNKSGLIYVTYIRDQSSDPAELRFRTVDTESGDALGTDILIDSFAGQTGWAFFEGFNDHNLSIVRAESGRLYVAVTGHAFGGGWRTEMYQSDNGGATWSASAADPFDATDQDKVTLVNDLVSADPDDIYAVFGDASLSELELRKFDASAGTWSTVVADTGVGSSGFVMRHAPAVRDSDGMLFVSYTHAGTTDVRLLQYDGTTVTLLTDVISGAVVAQDERLSVTCTIDQGSGRIYVSYQSGGSGPFSIKYKFSDDSGVTWSAEQDFSESTYSRINFHNAPPTGGLFIAAWGTVFGDDRYLSNGVNAVELSDAVPPLPPPATVSPVAAVCAFGYEFDEVIDPLGNSFRLTDGLECFMLRDSGYGMPPIEYVTQRAPFQHGDQLVDFFARPRTIQLLIRCNAPHRMAWWTLRRFLLDAVRPNRQASPGRPVEALRYRRYRPDGQPFELFVMPDSTPSLPQRQRRGWDEWSVEDVFRFVAHDPIWRDPNELQALLTNGQDQLTFSSADQSFVGGADFEPGERIFFGGGREADVVYLGTWESFPTIILTGPVNNPTISNDATAQAIGLTYDVAAGEQVTFDLAPGRKTVVSGTFGNLIGTVNAGGDLATWALAPDPTAPAGRNTIRLTGADMNDQDTRVELRYHERFIGI